MMGAGAGVAVASGFGVVAGARGADARSPPPHPAIPTATATITTFRAPIAAHGNARAAGRAPVPVSALRHEAHDICTASPHRRHDARLGSAGMDRRHIAMLAAVAGLAGGALSSVGRAHLDGTLDAFANSVSTWLVAPFLVGTLAATRRGAAAAGLGTCAAQIAGYYVVADLIGAGTTGALIAFWTACALVGGPAFGIAGHLWRTAVPQLKGLGVAALAGVFVAEGLYAYVHQLHQYRTGALWIGLGAALALLFSRARLEQLRWLGLTVPLGISGEAALTALLDRWF
jgi:hypothetical protein